LTVAHRREPCEWCDVQRADAETRVGRRGGGRVDPGEHGDDPVARVVCPGLSSFAWPFRFENLFSADERQEPYPISHF